MESARRERIIPLPEFFLGPHQTDQRPDEILTEVILPVQEDSSAFLKLGRAGRSRRGGKKDVRLAIGLG
jgi:CO/xanthine dehydrogenase FAD-binding subunit